MGHQTEGCAKKSICESTPFVQCMSCDMSYTSHCGLHTEGFYVTAGPCTAPWECRKEYIQHSANHLKIALTQHQHTLNKLRWSSSPRQRSQGVGNPAFRLSPRKVIGQSWIQGRILERNVFDMSFLSCWHQRAYSNPLPDAMGLFCSGLSHASLRGTRGSNR